MKRRLLQIVLICGLIFPQVASAQSSRTAEDFSAGTEANPASMDSRLEGGNVAITLRDFDWPDCSVEIFLENNFAARRLSSSSFEWSNDEQAISVVDDDWVVFPGEAITLEAVARDSNDECFVDSDSVTLRIHVNATDTSFYWLTYKE